MSDYQCQYRYQCPMDIINKISINSFINVLYIA